MPQPGTPSILGNLIARRQKLSAIRQKIGLEAAPPGRQQPAAPTIRKPTQPGPARGQPVRAVTGKPVGPGPTPALTRPTPAAQPAVAAQARNFSSQIPNFVPYAARPHLAGPVVQFLQQWHPAYQPPTQTRTPPPVAAAPRAPSPRQAYAGVVPPPLPGRTAFGRARQILQGGL
jgi:hypothetical protein